MLAASSRMRPAALFFGSAAKHETIQVKYTNLAACPAAMLLRTNQPKGRESDAFDFRGSLASSGSNQAREGRLVDALAVRGDEGRDNLR